VGKVISARGTASHFIFYVYVMKITEKKQKNIKNKTQKNQHFCAQLGL